MQQRRPNNEISVIGKTRGLRGFGSHTLRKTAEPILTGDPITGTEAFDLFTAGGDYASGIRSRHVRQARPHLIAAANHQIVHVADRGGVDVDQNFVGRRMRFGRLANSQCFDPIEALAKHRTQFEPPRFGSEAIIAKEAPNSCAGMVTNLIFSSATNNKPWRTRRPLASLAQLSLKRSVLRKGSMACS